MPCHLLALIPFVTLTCSRAHYNYTNTFKHMFSLRKTFQFTLGFIPSFCRCFSSPTILYVLIFKQIHAKLLSFFFILVQFSCSPFFPYLYIFIYFYIYNSSMCFAAAAAASSARVAAAFLLALTIHICNVDKCSFSLFPSSF